VLTLSTNIHDGRLDGSLAKLPGDLSRILALGLGGVEIGVHGTDAIRCGRLDRRRTSEFASILRDHPLALSVHSPDTLDLMARRDGALHLEVFRSCLEFCELAGARVLVVHPGRWVPETDFGVVEPWRPGPDEALEALEAEAETIRRIAAEFPNVVVALENARTYLPYSPYAYAEFPDRLAEQVDRIGLPNVGICLDTGHLHMSSRLHGFPESEGAARLAGRLAHLHVHDNFGRTGYWTEKTQTHQIPLGRGDLHMPPGLGDIDYALVLGPLLAGFDGIAVCELRGRYLDGLGGHIAAFKAMMERIGGG